MLKFKIRDIPAVAAHLGLEMPDEWTLDDVWPLLDRAREEGAVILLKLDGERSRNWYTVVMSGGGMERKDVLHVDSPTMELAIARVLGEYAVRVWGYTRPVER